MCHPGTYSAPGSASCNACPAGWACPFPDDPGAVERCEFGSFASENSTACAHCPPGFSCPSTLRPPVVAERCAPGAYSVAGEGACAACLVGHECADQGVPPTPCDAGYYSLGRPVGTLDPPSPLLSSPHSHHNPP